MFCFVLLYLPCLFSWNCIITPALQQWVNTETSFLEKMILRLSVLEQDRKDLQSHLCCDPCPCRAQECRGIGCCFSSGTSRTPCVPPAPSAQAHNILHSEMEAGGGTAKMHPPQMIHFPSVMRDLVKKPTLFHQCSACISCCFQENSKEAFPRLLSQTEIISL